MRPPANSVCHVWELVQERSPQWERKKQARPLNSPLLSGLLPGWGSGNCSRGWPDGTWAQPSLQAQFQGHLLQDALHKELEMFTPQSEQLPSPCDLAVLGH